ncbi:hypothetical protein CASFOL_028079 [Castilleja foliolosa]|uniref:ubiquitinyl hydrolase 1 n=1 Tax=Castilleja foliolosa TaxID=1961234 RepID=A0ABD3CH14_9LAMI
MSVMNPARCNYGKPPVLIQEEENLGPNDRLIHVYHFTKESAQNQVQVQNFAKPFFLVIHEGETLAQVKARIRKKLQVAGGEFSRKFAFLSLERPEYLQEFDVLSTRFQEETFMVLGRSKLCEAIDKCEGGLEIFSRGYEKLVLIAACEDLHQEREWRVFLGFLRKHKRV